MQLIREVEIAYFRSFYKSALYKCKDLNIIFGKNDAGKSNIIRALNLFFNNVSDQVNDFDFDIDFCDSRSEESEKSEDIRKFIYVKLTFNTPPSYKNSLGEYFYVKRQWTVSRGDQFIEELSSSINPKHKHIATRFINKIRFIHVPAIKDISIFEKLLSDIYETLSNKKEFIDAVSDFTNRIQNSTVGLFDNLPKEISSETKISVPNRLNALFESLDFDTKIRKENHSVSKSLTTQRGDGVKARHIPELLNFISANDGYSYHIWGFEEPENSLDFVAAESEAQRFEKICQTDRVQIFTTTHSPSFYNLNSDYTNKYYVGYGEKGSSITQGKDLDKIDAITAMSEGFYLPAVAESLKKFSEQQKVISNYRLQLEKLSEEIVDLAKPILLTEGRTDAIILQEAWKRLYKLNCPFKIRECDTSADGALGGAGGATKLADCLKTVPATNKHKVLGLFDRDDAGIAAFKLDKNFHQKDLLTDIKYCTNGMAVGLIIPAPEYREKCVKYNNLPIEFIFEDKFLSKKIDGKGLELRRMHASRKIGSEVIRIPLDGETEVFEIEDSSKLFFAEKVVPSYPDEAFGGFKQLFEVVLKIVK